MAGAGTGRGTASSPRKSGAGPARGGAACDSLPLDELDELDELEESRNSSCEDAGELSAALEAKSCSSSTSNNVDMLKVNTGLRFKPSSCTDTVRKQRKKWQAPKKYDLGMSILRYYLTTSLCVPEQLSIVFYARAYAARNMTSRSNQKP